MNGCTRIQADVKEDLSLYAPPGVYDSVHVIWYNGTIDSYFGLGGAFINQGATTFDSIIAGEAFWWTDIGEHYGEVILHEWLHGVERFYRERGFKMPEPDALHSAERHGYSWKRGDGWMSWYRDYMRGNVWEPNINQYTGISYAAWQSGTPRDVVGPSLYVSKNGTGDGRIISDVKGIDCGQSCLSSYRVGSAISLTPIPNVGSRFDGWSGDCVGLSYCKIAVDNEKNISATFTSTEKYFNVTVKANDSGRITSTPQGIDCGSVCTASFNENTNVVLSATPNKGYSFSGWSGACSGTAPCTLTMSADKQVTATFTMDKLRTLVTTVSGVGNISVRRPNEDFPSDCSNSCTYSLQNNSTVALSATAGNGYSFSGWSGACSGTASCTLTMDADKQVTATFTKLPVFFSINASVNGSGRITSTPQGIDCGTACNTLFGENTNVVLYASPNVGYSFSGWSGACSGTPQCSLTMNGDKQVTANFIQIPPNPYDPTKPFVKPNIPSTTAFVKQPFTIGWQLNMIRKNMPVRVKFAKDGGVFRVIKSTKANAAGVGAYRWKPTKAHRTANGQLQICAVPSRGMAEVCSPTTNITAQ